MQFLMKVNPPTRHPAQLRSLLVNCFCTCDSSCVVLISHTFLWTVIYSTLEIKFLLEPNMPCDSTREWNITTVTLFCHWLFLIQQEQSGQIKIEAQGIKSLVSLHQSPWLGSKLYRSRYWNSLQITEGIKERTPGIDTATSVAFVVNAVFLQLCQVWPVGRKENSKAAPRQTARAEGQHCTLIPTALPC